MCLSKKEIRNCASGSWSVGLIFGASPMFSTTHALEAGKIDESIDHLVLVILLAAL